MGYYTDYKLTTEPALPNTLISEDYKASTDEDGVMHLSDAKWYGHMNELIPLSKKHKKVLFTLDGRGEESEDIWRKYIKDGKVQMWRMPCATPDPFDPKKLEDYK